jgi:hypothetical protein
MENISEITTKVKAFEQAKTHLAAAINELIALRKLLKENWAGLSFHPFSNEHQTDLQFNFIKESDIDIFCGNVEKLVWYDIFRQSEAFERCSDERGEAIRKYIYSKDRKPFNEANIQSFLAELNAQKGNLFCGVIKETYRKFCSLREFEAGMPFKNKIVVDSSSWGSLSFHTQNSKWESLEKSFLLLDNKTVPEDYREMLHNKMDAAHRQGHISYEDDYFAMKFYQKGTVHVTFKRLDLLRCFNEIALQR